MALGDLGGAPVRGTWLEGKSKDGRTVVTELATPTVLDAAGNTVIASSPQDGAVKISTNDIYIFDEFGSATDFANNWQVVKQTGDASYTLANSELQISTGTNAASELIILSKQKVRLGQTRLQFAAYLSQRIANQEFYVELVDAESVGADGTGGDELCGFGFWGTSATTAYVRYGDHGFGQMGLGVGDQVTVGSTNSPQLFEMDADVDDITFYCRVANAGNVRTTLRTQNANFRPNPAEEFVLRIRVRNTGTPGSSTTFALQSLLLDDHTRFAVEVASGRGINNAAQAIPVFATGGTLSAAARSYSQYFTDSTIPLGASASFTGTTRDQGNDPAWQYAYAVAEAYADQAGTLYIDVSRNGTNWVAGGSQAVTANTLARLQVPLARRYWRVRYTNGAIAQTTFELVSAMKGVL